MKNAIICIVALLLQLSCQKKQDETNTKTTKQKKFEMYEMSEMASLMEQMYAHNQQLRLQIIKGDSVGTFPEFFNKIYSAKFTTPTDNDSFFKENAKIFFTSQQLIFSDSKKVKENFNKSVDACISCHNGKCSLPIPRIKKLYIK